MSSPYVIHNKKVCITYSVMHELGMTKELWDKYKLKAKQLGLVTVPGGNGRQSLMEFIALPTKWQEKVTEVYGTYGNFYHPFDDYFELDNEARKFFEEFTLWDEDTQSEKRISKENIERYTINASVLNAVINMKRYREEMTVRLGNAKRNLWNNLCKDTIDYNQVLQQKYSSQHTLPKNVRKFQQKVNNYIKRGYEALIDKRLLNNNAQLVTPQMLQLWSDMFSGRPYKPSHIEVYEKYTAFLEGKLDVINIQTGELYDRLSPNFHVISERTIYRWMERWEFRAPAYMKRSRNRQLYMGQFIPHARMESPKYAGSLISVDDFQPPFKYDEGTGKRMWFYIAADVASGAITSWVYGTNKEGLISEFYRNLVRQYNDWVVPLPYGIEAESNLNSTLKETVLKPGIIFQDIRIIANDARQKRIERLIGEFKQAYLYKQEGAIYRPHARAELYQGGNDDKIEYKNKDEIVDIVLKAIERWNNSLHPNQKDYSGKTRWEVFIEHQHPELHPINWYSVLRAVGYETKTSCKLARVRLQNAHRVLGDGNGNLLLGDKLIGVLKEIEGKEVSIRWIDDSNGNVLKAFIYDNEGRFISEALDELRYQRAKLEQTEQDILNIELMARYRNTVEGFIRNAAKQINKVEIIEHNQDLEPKKIRFSINKKVELEDMIRTGNGGVEPINTDDDWIIMPEQVDFKINTIDRL